MLATSSLWCPTYECIPCITYKRCPNHYGYWVVCSTTVWALISAATCTIVRALMSHLPQNMTKSYVPTSHKVVHTHVTVGVSMSASAQNTTESYIPTWHKVWRTHAVSQHWEIWVGNHTPWTLFFSLFPFNLTMDFPLSSTRSINIYKNCEG